MPGERILILGGTRDGRELAAALMAEGFDTITSLAGVTENPALPPGALRRGGFGGSEGLQAYLRDSRISAVVDATHPFAAQMSAHARWACDAARVPLLRLERPAWQPQPGDLWIPAASAADAASLLPAGARALVTIGRKELAAFLARSDVTGVARMIEPPPQEMPGGWRLILERPPFTVESEIELITHHAITHLVTKNAGGTDTAAKLAAARELQVPVLMIARPGKPSAVSFPEVKEIVMAIRRLLLP